MWKPYAQSIEGHTMLILDQFQAHLTASVREAIAACNTELEIIPGGYTSKLQAMDVGLNKPFKDRMRWKMEEHMTASVEVEEKITRQVVSKWIESSWDGLPAMMFNNTFAHIFSKEFICDLDGGDEDDVVDPIGLNPGSKEHSKEDEDYNTDSSMEF